MQNRLVAILDVWANPRVTPGTGATAPALQLGTPETSVPGLNWVDGGSITGHPRKNSPTARVSNRSHTETTLRQLHMERALSISLFFFLFFVFFLWLGGGRVLNISRKSKVSGLRKRRPELENGQ